MSGGSASESKFQPDGGTVHSGVPGAKWAVSRLARPDKVFRQLITMRRQLIEEHHAVLAYRHDLKAKREKLQKQAELLARSEEQLKKQSAKIAEQNAAIRDLERRLAKTWNTLSRTRSELAAERTEAAHRQEPDRNSADQDAMISHFRAELRAATRELDETKRELRKAVRLADRKSAERRTIALGYRRLLAAARGTTASKLPPNYFTASDDDGWDNSFVEEVRRLFNDAALTRLINHGSSLEEAVLAVSRQGRGGPDPATWRAVCQSLAQHENTTVAGTVGCAVLAQRLGQRELALDLLSRLPVDDVARLAPVEYLRAGLHSADTGRRDEVLQTATGWIDRRLIQQPKDLVSIAQLFFVADRAQTVLGCIDLVSDLPDVDEQIVSSMDFLRPWALRKLNPPVAETLPEGTVSFGVIDYKHPDEQTASTNIGDYIQTIAALGHLLRHSSVRLHGDDDLVEVASFLQERVRPELQIGPSTPDLERLDVQLTPVHRDASSLAAIPENTWMLAFGWYMQSQFDLAYDFPFHPNVNPIFVSFHCNKVTMLTEPVLDYLRAHSPIGCRDWTTVHMLLSAGVPAFFSGCITTTINTVFPADVPTPDPSAPVAYVDVPNAPSGTAVIHHVDPLVRAAPAPQNIKEAIALLERYRMEFSQVVTSRLHCYLPSWSIGANVEFRPRNRADIRFAGLLDATEHDLQTMQQRIRRLLAPVMGRILAGAGRDEVYTIWRAVCAEEVARARRLHNAPVSAPVGAVDVEEVCRTVADTRLVVPAEQPRFGSPINIGVALDGNLRDQLPTVIAGVVDNTDRPVHVFALARDHTPVDYQRLRALFPEVTFEWYSCDGVDYGPVLRMLRHITVSTMDRLLLPKLLPHVDKLIYHDIDALSVVDLSGLADVELGGAPLGARPSNTYGYRHGVSALLSSTRLLHERPEAARSFVRTITRQHQLDFRTFNAGILLINLAKMRADHFTETYLPYVERYGLNDQEVLNAYAGSQYQAIDDRWNSWPAQEIVQDPWVLHWAGPAKPWEKSRFVLFRDVWEAAEARVNARLEHLHQTTDVLEAWPSQGLAPSQQAEQRV